MQEQKSKPPLGAIADVAAGEQIEFRVLVLVDGVEMDRKTVDPLIIKHQTSRDGEALKEQASEGQFTITLFIIALLSVGFGVYTMVMSRRILKGEEVDESDQTAEVLADIDVKALPSIELNLPPPPGLALPPQVGLAAVIPAPTPQPIAAPLAEQSANVAEGSRGVTSASSKWSPRRLVTRPMGKLWLAVFRCSQTADNLLNQLFWMCGNG